MERMRGGPGATMPGGKARAHLRAGAAAGSCMVVQLSPGSCIAQPCAHRLSWLGLHGAAMQSHLWVLL
jgi:hypothetical protein